MTEATRYPLDFDALHKGSVISEDELNRICGFQYSFDPDKWKLRQLALSGIIKKRLAEAGKNVRVKCAKRSIMILVDLDASYDASKARNKCLKQAISNQLDVLAVDASKFSDVEKRRHDREIQVGCNYIQGLAHAHFRPALFASRKALPTPLLADLS